MTDTFQAFFSYATADWDDPVEGEHVQSLVNGLSPRTNTILVNASFDLWQDRQKLRWGDTWLPKLKEEVSKSDLFIALVSQKWLTSSYCALEYQTFKDCAAKWPGEGRILPLLLRQIPDSDLVHLTDKQRCVYGELRTIQMQRFPKLANITAEGTAPSLERCSTEIKNRIGDLRGLQKPPTEKQETRSPAPTSPPINVNTVAPFSSTVELDGRQGEGCFLDFFSAGLAKAITNEGEVVFRVRELVLNASVTDGTPTRTNPDFHFGWQGALAHVQQLGIDANYQLYLSFHEDARPGYPLADPKMGKWVRLFDVEGAAEGAPEVHISLSIQWDCIEIVTDGAPPTEQVQHMQRKILSILQNTVQPDMPLRDDDA
ncbi:MAG: toll/interleukin-1 receptor domain-containing protein [Mangrovicoccus sp.]